ncbi:MAG: hypothetical protein GXP49_08560 [Deltaproteobacteria bacterium]|nr:hypothetical protein [Deltaproteobacteria bacterium]
MSRTNVIKKDKVRQVHVNPAYFAGAHLPPVDDEAVPYDFPDSEEIDSARSHWRDAGSVEEDQDNTRRSRKSEAGAVQAREMGTEDFRNGENFNAGNRESRTVSTENDKPKPDKPHGTNLPAETKAAVLTASVLVEAQKRGWQEGRAKAESEMRELLAGAAATLAQVGKLAESLRAEVAMDAMEIASEIAQRILERELEISPQEVVKIGRRAMKKLGGKRFIIRTNEKDADLFKKILKPPQEEGQAVSIEIVVDKKISRGGVIVESEQGLADARLKTQVEELIGAGFGRHEGKAKGDP